MTHDQKINYMRIAAGIAGFGFTLEQMDLLVSLYELVLEKKGDANLKDVADKEAQAKERADVRARSKLLDKVSKKR